MDWDVVVVGGGPAGAAAAAAVASHGLRAGLFERSGRGRPKPCGDALSPTALAELGRLGVTPGVLRRLGGVEYDGLDLYHDDQFVAEMDTPAARGWAIGRDVLDQELRDRAGAAGATVRYDTAVRDVQPAGGKLEVTVREAERGHAHTTRAVILAHGGGSHLARNAGVEGAPDRAVGLSWYTDGTIPNRLRVEFTAEVRPGYEWAFPSAAGANRGIFAWGDHTSTSLRAVAAIRRAAVEAQAGPVRGGTVPVWSGRESARHSRVGIVSCGDAAAIADPLTGEGIGPALESGRMAGAAVAAWLSGDGPALVEYSDWATHRCAERYQPSLERMAIEYYSNGGAGLAPITSPQ